MPFAAALADGILRLATGPDDLARALIMVPSRRAARALQAAFLDAQGGAAMLLPRMVPIGDIDDDDVDLLGAPETLANLLPAVTPLRRQIILSSLLENFALGGHKPTQSQAMLLAESLGQLLDQLYNADAEPSALRDLLPEQFSRHWQDILTLFTILVERWPDILAAENVMDAADRRNKLTRARTALWRANPPDNLIILAGSTGTFAATSDLIACVAGLPRGHVVLPGLDAGAIDHWDAISNDAGHPQHQLASLLARLEVAPQYVQTWPCDMPVPIETTRRQALMREVFKPAALTTEWRMLARDKPELTRDALAGLELVECADKQSEANIIALSMRQVLETPGRTAALITPDRPLAEAVIAALRRWDITVDDSAGQPLSGQPVGIFLSLLANAVAADFAPRSLLGLLKHPLASGGLAPAIFHRRVRVLDRAKLRGYIPKDGLNGILAQVKDHPDLEPLVRDHIQAPLAPLAHAWHMTMPTLAGLSRTLAETAERMAAQQTDAEGMPDSVDGAQHLWRGDDGEAAAGLLQMLAEHGHDCAVDPAEFPQILFQLMQSVTVRSRWQSHRRLLVLGPVEARMQQADRVILGGFNEGHWPPEPDHDPWMNASMRQVTGLPVRNWRTGLSAHDVYMAICAPEVIITRSLRERDAVTTPSRWLQRFAAVSKSLDIDTAINRGAHRLGWLAQLDPVVHPNPVPRPNPKPPVALRPRQFSATEFDRWIGDPYAIYARRILGLRRLDDLEPTPNAALRGNLFHDVFARFITAFPKGPMPGNALAEIEAIGRKEFADYWHEPTVRFFWWPRFQTVASWFVAQETARREILRNSLAEVKGRLTLNGPAGDVVITARADRIDLADDGLSVIDYKTGEVPSAKSVAAGRRTQLLVEALIASRGGFAGIDAGVIAAMQYWKLSGKRGNVATVNDVLPSDWHPDHTAAQIEALIADFDKVDTGYPSQPHPKYAPTYSDFVHLARVREWSMEGDNE